MTDTDTLIKNKDIAVDSGGRYIHISGDDEILQQAFFKISAKFAGFVYNRELGCELNKVDFDDENFQEKVNLIMSQALADFPTVTAKVLALRKPKFSIRLICNESVRETFEKLGNLQQNEIGVFGKKQI